MGSTSQLAAADRAPAPGWRREAMRTTLWVVPTLLVVVAIVLFAVDLRHRSRRRRRAAINAARLGHAPGAPTRPPGCSSPSPRRVITVVGVVFSVTIVALTLASHPVRSAHAAQLHPRPRHPVHAGRVRRHLRVQHPGPGLGRPAPGRVRPPPLDHRGAWRCSWSTWRCSSTSSTTWPSRSSSPEVIAGIAARPARLHRRRAPSPRARPRSSSRRRIRGRRPTSC